MKLWLRVTAFALAATLGAATIANAGTCTSTYNPYTKQTVTSCY